MEQDIPNITSFGSPRASTTCPFSVLSQCYFSRAFSFHYMMTLSAEYGFSLFSLSAPIF